MSCADFMGELFLARDVAHSVHLNTRSYSKHKALRHFYENVLDAADKFAEAYQGRHGLIGPITLKSARKDGAILPFLEDSLAYIEENRYKVCGKTDTTLQNIIDEIIAVYLSALYKLRFLA
jgi:hypothetical protein